MAALHERLSAKVFASSHLFADDTPIPVLDPGRGRTKTGRLWVYARDDRPWGGPDPPAAVYVFATDRRSERPAAHLAAFKGVLQVDGYAGFGYAGFERLTAAGDIRLAACWAHTRRKFHEISQATGSPVAAEALRRIAELYAVEAQVGGQSAALRKAARLESSRPLTDALHAWLQQQLVRVPPRGQLAEAIRYALTRWEGLTLFLADGRVELDNNTVERAIRPVALGRKDHLFAGSDGGGARWAVVASLIETARMNASSLTPPSPMCWRRWSLVTRSTAWMSCCPGPGPLKIPSSPDRRAAPGCFPSSRIVNRRPSLTPDRHPIPCRFTLQLRADIGIRRQFPARMTSASKTCPLGLGLFLRGRLTIDLESAFLVWRRIHLHRST